MTHVQLYSRHLHYNEPSKATGQFKNIEKKKKKKRKKTATDIQREFWTEELLILHIIIFF